MTAARTRTLGVSIGALLIAVIALVALFDWDWLRGPLTRYLSGQFNRPVTIGGRLTGEWSWTPKLQADDFRIGNAPWSDDAFMFLAQRAAVRVDLRSLFQRRWSLPELAFTQPRLLLERDASGRANWHFDGAPLDPASLPEVDTLIVDRGSTRYRDPATGTDVTLDISTSPGGSETPVRFSGQGTLRGNAFTTSGRAGSLLGLQQFDKAYRLNADATAGATQAHFDGTLVPARPDNVDGLLTLQGRDLSQLYPILPLPLPWSPPYRLSGRLQHGDAAWTLRDFTGKVGASDVSGQLSVNATRERPFIDADLVSQHLNYNDLGGLVGLPPASAPPHTRTAAQNAQAAKQAETGRALSTKPYNLERLRVVDASVRLKGTRIVAADFPLDHVVGTLSLQNGVLKLDPLEFGIAGGHMDGKLTLDASADLIRTRTEFTARNLELKQLIPALSTPTASAGKVGGKAQFAATGNSVAAMLGSLDGEIALISHGGKASELAVVLTNVDLASAAQILVRGDADSPIRCVVADFVATGGVMDARTLVMDTEAEKILGQGQIDLRQERYDLALRAQSKRPSLIALRGPIVVDGTLKHPAVHPSVGPIAARVGAAVALGATLSPVAALIPLIDFGGASDADCRALMDDAQQNVTAGAKAKRATESSTANRNRQSPAHTREASAAR